MEEEVRLLLNEKRRQKALRKFYGLDIVPVDPNFNKERLLAYGFDVDYSSYSHPPRIIKSTWGDNYDIALYARLGLHCYNFQNGTNLKFGRWEKYNCSSTAFDLFYVTLEAKDGDSVLSFQTLLCEDSCPPHSILWTILACRFKCVNGVDENWDDTAVDGFYKDAIPKWSSVEELNNYYYVVQESELQENEWLHLFTEIAFYPTMTSDDVLLTAPPDLEIEKVVVVTKDDTDEKLKAKDAIFYVSYKYNGESSTWGRDHKAVIRKTMDGKPGHMRLEVAAIAEDD